MSRIIKNIFDSVLTSETNEGIMLHSNRQSDITFTKNLIDKIYIFEPHQFANNFVLLNQDQINLDISVRPRYVLNMHIVHFQNALSLAETLKIPLVNIFDDLGHLKKEGIFSVASLINQHINIIFDETLIQRLYLTKYNLIKSADEIPNIIYEGIKCGS